jgi:hypothetical protein
VGARGPKPKPLKDRILALVVRDPETGCWEWLAATDGNGYARITVGGKALLAHRVSHKEFIGPIPDGFTVDHVRARGCIRRDCTNPAHLEAVPHRVNLLRGETISARNAAKTHCPAGHAYSIANTRIERDGSRKCRACDRERHAAKAMAA